MSSHWYVIYSGNKTEWSPIWSVIIQVIDKIGRTRSGITSVITDRIGRQEVLSLINHNHFNFRKNNLKQISPVETMSFV